MATSVQVSPTKCFYFHIIKERLLAGRILETERYRSSGSCGSASSTFLPSIRTWMFSSSHVTTTSPLHEGHVPLHQCYCSSLGTDTDIRYWADTDSNSWIVYREYGADLFTSVRCLHPLTHVHTKSRSTAVDYVSFHAVIQDT